MLSLKTLPTTGTSLERIITGSEEGEMRSPTAVRKEYKKVCQAMKDLAKQGSDRRTPLPKDEELYCRLAAIKDTLEWIHPRLIKTTAKGHDRFNELAGHKHYVMGPTHAELYP
jgi:hypothetical protein